MIGIFAGLVVGKPIGIVVSAGLLTWLTRVNLHPQLKWIELIGVGLLAGIEFIVSLLIPELSFSANSPYGDDAKIAIMAVYQPGWRRARRSNRSPVAIIAVCRPMKT
jgi:NhaA family Na+:H+ antiporter